MLTPSGADGIESVCLFWIWSTRSLPPDIFRHLFPASASKHRDRDCRYHRLVDQRTFRRLIPAGERVQIKAIDAIREE